MDSCITRAEHEEFTKRMEAEHTRQNRRIELLEENVEPVSYTHLTLPTTAYV